MTIEQLEKMASDLYRESADAIPGTSTPDKENWIAKRIEEAIQNKGPLLQKLKASHSREEVYKLLKHRYGEMTYGDEYDTDDAEETALEPDNPEM